MGHPTTGSQLRDLSNKLKKRMEKKKEKLTSRFEGDMRVIWRPKKEVPFFFIGRWGGVSRNYISKKGRSNEGDVG